jgi:hypothetical protein
VRQSILHVRPLEPFFWPPGYPLLVALTSLVLGPVPLAGQLMSLLMGALVPVLTVLLARALWPEDTALALLAGALVAVCGQLWQSSVVVMADTTGLALATFSALALVRYAGSRHVAWLIAASAAIAAATLSRWIYGLVAVPFTLYAASVLFDRRDHARWSIRLMHAAAAIAIAALILGPVVAEPLFGLVRDPAQPASFAGNFQVYSWSPLNALRHDFFTADGHLAYARPNGLYYAMAPANPAYFGPLLAVWILLGLWAARRWPLRNIALVVGWAAIVFIFHAGAPWQNFRFTLAYLPPLAILAAAGALLVWRWLPAERRPDEVRRRLEVHGMPAERRPDEVHGLPEERWPPEVRRPIEVRWLAGLRTLAEPRPTLRAFVAVCLVVGLVTTAAAAVRLVERFIDTKDRELALVHWVQLQTPANAELFSFGPTLAFRHYSGLPTFDLFDLSPADVEAILGHPASHYLLVDTASVQSQWLDQAPSRNFQLLRDQVGLQELGTADGYTLYQVTP